MRALSLWLLWGGLLLSACTASRTGEPLKGPLSAADPAVVQGRLTFYTYCQKCHPGGEAGLGPSLVGSALPGFLKRYQVRHGWGMMPAFSKETLPPAELANVMAYLRALEKR